MQLGFHSTMGCQCFFVQFIYGVHLKRIKIDRTALQSNKIYNINNKAPRGNKL